MTFAFGYGAVHLRFDRRGYLARIGRDECTPPADRAGSPALAAALQRGGDPAASAP